MAIGVAILLAILALLLVPPRAHANFVYWSSDSPSPSIGRAKINGSGLNNNFITGLGQPVGVAVDSKFIYWADRTGNRVGRANLDGTGVNQNFITTGVVNPQGVAVTPNAIYWTNNPGGSSSIGHANIDGTSPAANFITTSSFPICELAADSNFLYWDDNAGHLVRAPLGGPGPGQNFVSGVNINCALAVDPNFLYWGTDGGNGVGRAPIGGGAANNNFVQAGTTSGGPVGVAVNSQYIFWGDSTTKTIGRANINGSSLNHDLIAGTSVAAATQMVAAPSNKITINSITPNKKKGTTTIDAKVPGPGQVTLSQTSLGQDVNATAAAVKQIGLTTTQASSFKLPVKPTGKTAKKLKKQVAKNGKGKVKVGVFITYVPAGVAGVPNSDPLTVKLVKRGTKRK